MAMKVIGEAGEAEGDLWTLKKENVGGRSENRLGMTKIGLKHALTKFIHSLFIIQ